MRFRNRNVKNIKFNSDGFLFVKRNKIDLNQFIMFDECYLKDVSDINEIVSKYRIQSKLPYYDYLSLDKLLGIKGEGYINILSVMDRYFDSDGDDYRNRSVSLLDYSSLEIVDVLRNSFEKDSIDIIECDIDKYSVFFNGKHRFIILRLHYLNDKINGISQNELSNKYKILVKVNPTDYFKTYSNYIISSIDSNIRLGSSKCENCSTIYDKKNSTKFIMSDEVLIDFVKLKLSFASYDFINELMIMYNKYASFKEYVDSNFEELIKKEKHIFVKSCN